jgi:hypothetical protein
VWPGRPPAEQQPASDDHYYYRHDGPTARGHRVKIACTSTPAILILVFANINDAGRLFAIKFHRPPAVVVSFPTMRLRPQPPAGYWIPSHCTTKPKRERGVEKPYPTRAQLIDGSSFSRIGPKSRTGVDCRLVRTAGLSSNNSHTNNCPGRCSRTGKQAPAPSSLSRRTTTCSKTAAVLFLLDRHSKYTRQGNDRERETAGDYYADGNCCLFFVHSNSGNAGYDNSSSNEYGSINTLVGHFWQRTWVHCVF